MIAPPSSTAARADGGPAPDRADPARPLRVLHCYTGNYYGGLEVLLVSLARLRALCPALEPEYALCFEGQLAEELRAAGVMVHDLGAVQFRRPWQIVRARHRLARLLAARRPDVVLAHDCWPHCLVAPTVRRAAVPLAFWGHGVPVGDRWYERLARRTRPDLVLADSHFIAGLLPRLFPGAEPATLYYPIAPPELGPAERAVARQRLRRELGAAPEEVVIALTARLSPYKGHTLLLEALAHLRDRPGWTAWIAGGAQQPVEHAHRARLVAQAEAAGIADRVRFLGHRRDIAELLAAADVHCQPNTGPEPFGIAFIEALYAGLPVVTTRQGGAVEIVEESCGVLVEPGDAAGLAAVLDGLITDPERRARLGAAGPARATALCEPAAALAALQQRLAAARAEASEPTS